MSTLTEAPQIFEGGKFVMPDQTILDQLDELQRGALDAVRAAYEHNAETDAKLADAMERQKDLAQQSSDLRKLGDRLFPPTTPHDLWLQNFGPKTRR